MATTTNYGWTTPDDTALVKDGASAIRSLGTSVDTTTKNLNPSTTLGDIEYRSSTANTNTRLAIGSTGNILTVVGGVPAWSAPAGGGKVLQVVQATYSTTTSITSETYTDTGLTASITPSSASSKVLVMLTQPYGMGRNIYDFHGGIRLLRGATTVWDGGAGGYAFGLNITGTSPNPTQMSGGAWASAQYLDSPSTTSSTTYKTQARIAAATDSAFINLQGTDNPAIMILMEIGA